MTNSPNFVKQLLWQLFRQLPGARAEASDHLCIVQEHCGAEMPASELRCWLHSSQYTADDTPAKVSRYQCRACACPQICVACDWHEQYLEAKADTALKSLAQLLAAKVYLRTGQS